MKRRLFWISSAAAAVLVPWRLAAAQSNTAAVETSRGVEGLPALASASGSPSLPHVGDATPAGGGTTYQLPQAGSGIDTGTNIPGLNVPYGAATGGLFPSPPTDQTSGYVARSATNQPPATGEIDGYLGSDGRSYYRVVNRGPHGVTYSH